MALDEISGKVNATAPAPKPAEQPAPPAPSAPVAPPRPPGAIPTMRTFENDLTRTMRGESVASVVIKESERRFQRGTPTPQAEKTNSILIAFSALLVFGGITLAGYFIYAQYTTPQTETTPVAATQSLIFSDISSKINIDQFPEGELSRRLRRKLSETNRKLGEVEEVVVTKTIPVPAENGETQPAREIRLNTTEFLATIAPTSPDGLRRSLGGNFMFGIYAGTKDEGFGFFTTEDQEKVYSELLDWEQRGMIRDLAPVFHNEQITLALEDGVFVDRLIKNVDTRVLLDETGATVLLYAFLNPTRLVIAGSEDAFVEVLRRYTTPRPVVR